MHTLTTYPASNLNRDDLGRPKTVKMGGATRLRISSQSLKRAWRTSEDFMHSLDGHCGTRTKEIGKYAYLALTSGATFEEVVTDPAATGDATTLSKTKAEKIARTIGGVFAKNKAEYKAKKEDYSESKFLESLETEQMAHVSPAEMAAVAALVEQCRESGNEPAKDEVSLLSTTRNAVDVALFGRMLASSRDYNVEAACQVAHAMTVHKAVVEDDFFTAVDDLNRDDAGAGHMGVSEFGAGVFYTYVCIDRELLKENLDGDEELTNLALTSLARAALTTAPSGKQNSFASRAVASYCLVEKGETHPRTLAEAFLKPLEGGDVLEISIKEIEEKRESFNRMLGEESDSFVFGHDRGTLPELCEFITE